MSSRTPVVRLLFTAAVAYIATAASMASWADERSAPKAMKLDSAIAAFNKTASKSERGAAQPPLTEDEVVAAIRAWDEEQFKIGKPLKAVYESIANDRILPEGSQIEALSQYDMNGYHFTAWDIILEVRSGDEGYRFPIRRRVLSSEPMQVELKRLK